MYVCHKGVLTDTSPSSTICRAVWIFWYWTYIYNSRKECIFGEI